MNRPLTFFAVQPSSPAERTIAIARVGLALTSLLAVWIDPAEPARFAQLTYALHLVYVTYAVVLLFLSTLRWADGSRLPIMTHAIDIVAFSVFQYLTLGPSSPFFVYFIFSMFCGAMRWGWRGTMGTAAIVMVSYLVMGITMSRTLGPAEFELNRFLIRTAYLGVAAGLLVYLGRFEARLREEIERLARWPAPTGLPIERASEQIVAHAGDVLNARRVIVTWEADEEPDMNVVSWTSESGASAVKRAPDEADRLRPPVEASRLAASARFRTGRVSGQIFCEPLGEPSEELVPLTEVVAREIGASLDQQLATRQLQAIAASEERIRLARDLHDGVLQSLTGIRLELRTIAGALEAGDSEQRDRLFAMERALAMEQRDLRLFISGLKPGASDRQGQSTLASRLDALSERLALEWKAAVTITVSAGDRTLPEPLDQAVPLMVHEAVVNALKHGQPSRVDVHVDAAPESLKITVSDDGHGFPFRGRLDHAALSLSNIAPRSLLDRLTSLGGRMAIESSERGSRIEMTVSW